MYSRQLRLRALFDLIRDTRAEYRRLRRRRQQTLQARSTAATPKERRALNAELAVLNSRILDARRRLQFLTNAAEFWIDLAIVPVARRGVVRDWTRWLETGETD